MSDTDPAELVLTHGDGLDEPTGAPTGSHLCAFASPRRRLLGLGVAAHIEVPAPWAENLWRVSEALGAIGSDAGEQTRGGGPIAFGALPYDPGSPARFVLPETLWAHTSDGERWRTDLRPDRPGADDPPAPAQRPGPASEVAVRSVMPPQRWLEAVETARERIRAGELDKVVLAREIRLEADSDFDPASVWNSLCASHPGAFCFAVDDFVGASPELLVSRSGSTVRARPMAGTTRRSGSPEADQQAAAELLASEKNRWEHRITIDAVHDALLGWCSYLDAEPTPSVVPAGPVQHLATMVEGRLSRPEPSVLDLVAALHPTPAVGGHPSGAALELQRELEPHGRGRYAGPVGWVDAEGNGTFAVGIRAVELDGAVGRMFAGVGVVEDSEPLDELAETRAKAQALLSVLVRV